MKNIRVEVHVTESDPRLRIRSIHNLSVEEVPEEEDIAIDETVQNRTRKIQHIRQPQIISVLGVCGEED